MERINLNGKIYVDLDGLNQLIREHKKDTADGTKPGFICDDPEKRTFAMLALNHLGAVINREELDKKAQKRLAEIRADRERLEHPEMLFGVEAIPTKPTPSDVREIQKRRGYSNIIAKVMKTTEGKKFCLYLGGYIPGIRKPLSCLQCPCSGTDVDDGKEFWICEITHRVLTSTELCDNAPNDCPARPLPEHGEWIPVTERLPETGKV